MRRNPPAKWVLPATVDPIARKCIEVQVPDDPAHIAAFRGAMLTLASAYNWADDSAHTAKDVALVWREIIDGMTDWGCTTRTQIRADDICTLSWSYDDWVTFDSYDPSSCIEAIIDSYIADGRLQGGTGQQGPQPSPAPGSCVTYHVRMGARDKWIVPSAMSAGDVITIHNASGGWSDGTLAWYCPDGARYLLGSCDEALKSHQSGDPLNPGAYHMALIGNLDTTYFDPLTAAYIIPDGTPLSNVLIQANDGSLADNMGEVRFDAEVCTGATFTHVFDFAASDGGWSAIDGAGVYVSGQGWNGVRIDANSDPECKIHKTGFGSARIIRVVVTYNRSNASGANKLVRTSLRRVGAFIAHIDDTGSGVGTGLTQTLATDVIADEIYLDLNSGSGGGTNRYTRVEVTGIGTDPF